MHRHDRLRARRDPPRRVAHIEVETDRARIDEDRRRADARHAARRGEKSEARAEHLVARADAQRHQREQDRVGAGADAERVLRAGELRQRALEPLDFRPEDEVARAQHAQKGLVQFRLQRARSAPSGRAG